MADIFISYAREDREAATKLAHALEDRGYSVWWDPVIPPGKTWAEVIGTQLGAASCVVALWSAVSVTKRWVRKEATFADERNKLIPAKLEDVTIPFAFADVQAADLTGWEGNTSHEGFQHLVSAISELLRNPSSQQIEEDIVVATEQAKAQLAGSQATHGRPVSTGAKTEKLSLRAAVKRFRAHVRLPDRQTLLSKKAIIIGGVSVILLVSLLSILTSEETPGPNRASDGTANVGQAVTTEQPDWVPLYPGTKIENLSIKMREGRGQYGSFSFISKEDYNIVLAFYETNLKMERWNVKNMSGMLTATSEDGGQSITVTSGLVSFQWKYIVTFSESNR